jgi:D-hydroxyproline dehydrogenase subunit beta
VRAREVAVVGAGIVGAATARELAVRGVDVLLLDSRDVSGGTTGLGEGNVLCSDKDAGPELELCVHGLAIYDETVQRLGDDARIRRKGALIVHPDAETWAGESARLDRLRDAGVEARLVPADEVAAVEPALTGPVCGASLFPADIQVAPRQIARALAREAVDAGAEVRTGARVATIECAPAEMTRATTGGSSRVEGVVLDTGERVPAGAVVVAAGPWSAALAPLPVEPRKGQLVRLRAPAGTPLVRHKVVDASYMSSVLSADAALQLTTVVETTHDGDVLVGSSRERRGFDTSVDAAVTAAMVARAARLFPALARLPVAATWAGLRPWLPDHLPAIGPSRACDGLWLATGHEGAGVALGPVTGRLIAQAYTGEPTLVDLAPFDPDRFASAG